MIDDLAGLTAKRRRGAVTSLQNAARAALLLPLLLPGCSGVALPKEDAPESGPDLAYRRTVADYLKDSFKDSASYDAFEISDVRWIRSANGWSWLTCVRFQERDHRRTYALFIKANKVIDSRYAVDTDGCGAQAYSAFDLMPKETKPASGSELEPLH
jgi:hypothetical protein